MYFCIYSLVMTDGQLFRAVWSNGTVTLEEKAGEVTIRLLFVFAVLASIGGVSAYFFYDKMQNTATAKKKRNMAKDAAAEDSVSKP